MPAKIRLKKVGRKGQPSYRVVVLDGRKPRDAKVVADLGPYDPKTNPPTFEIDGDAALKWLLEGAKPTRAARNILSSAGVLLAWDAAKRGETVAIEAKELKADEPKKQPAAAVAEESPEAAVEKAAEVEVAEEPADDADAGDADADVADADSVESESESDVEFEGESVEEPVADEVPAAAEEAAEATASDEAEEAEEAPKAEKASTD